MKNTNFYLISNWCMLQYVDCKLANEKNLKYIEKWLNKES